MEAVMIFVFTCGVLYACYWSVRNDELKGQTHEKRKFRLPGHGGAGD